MVVICGCYLWLSVVWLSMDVSYLDEDPGGHMSCYYAGFTNHSQR
jgi:hypothetical protein